MAARVGQIAVLLAGAAVLAPPAGAADLPLATQVELQAGLDAARAGQWDAAAEHFANARRSDPAAPAPLYNLGLAEARLPGRELRAAGWLEAFLAVAPAAPNATAVRAEIDRLLAAADHRNAQVLASLTDLAFRLPVGAGGRGRFNAVAALDYAGHLQGEHGSPDGTIRVAEQLLAMQDPKSGYDLAANSAAQLAGVLAQHGRDREALAAAGRVQEGRFSQRSFAYGAVAEAQIQRGQLDEALSTCRLIDPHSSSLAPTLADLADAYTKAGRSAEAAAVWAQTDQAARTLGDRSLSGSLLANRIGHAYLAAGDWRKAREQVEQMQDFPNEPLRSVLAGEIEGMIAAQVTERMDAHDVAGARDLAAQLSFPDLQADALARLAERFPAERTGPAAAALREAMGPLLAAASTAAARFGVLAAQERLAAAGDGEGAASARRQAAVAFLAAVNEQRGVWEQPAAQFRQLVHRAILARDAAALEAAQSDAVPLFEKVPEEARDTFARAELEAGAGLARQTLAAADAQRLMAFARAHPTADGRVDFADLATTFFAHGDSATSDALLELIPDKGDRATAAANRAAASLGAALERGDPAKLAPEILEAKLPDDPKDDLLVKLAEAEAREGQFDAANAAIDAIKDGGAVTNATIAVAAQEEEGGTAKAVAEEWQGDLETMNAATDPAERAGWIDDLYERATTPAETRAVLHPWVEAKLKDVAPKDQVSKLLDAAQAAAAAGEYPFERQLRAEALDEAAIRNDFEGSTWIWGDRFYRLSAAEALDLGAGPNAAAMAARAAECFAHAGEFRRACALLARYDSAMQTGAASLSGHWLVDGGWISVMQAWPLSGRAAAVRTLSEHRLFGFEERSKVGLIEAQALAEAGRLAEAEKFIRECGDWQDFDDATADLAVAQAGATGWAGLRIDRLSADYTRQSTHQKLALLRLARGDMTGAAEDFWLTMTDPQIPPEEDCTKLIEAAVAGGLPALAQQWSAAYPLAEGLGLDALVSARVAAGDRKGAEALIYPVSRNDVRTRARRALATAILRTGDLEAARTAFRAAAAADARRVPDADSTDFTDHLLAVALADGDNPAAAVAVCEGVKDPFWRDAAWSHLATAAAANDVKVTVTALKGVGDGLERSSAGRQAVEASLAADHPDWALTYAAEIPDEGFRAGALGRVLNYAVNHCDVAPVVPAILALPDGAAKAWLLTDVVRAMVYLRLEGDASAVIGAARAAVAASPPGYWHVRQLADLARWAEMRWPAEAQGVLADAPGALAALDSDDVGRWRNFLHRRRAVITVPAATPAAAPPAVPPGPAPKSPAAAPWIALLDDPRQLAAPLFLDCAAAMDAAARGVPADSPDQAYKIFTAWREQLETLYRGRAAFAALQQAERAPGAP